jgi:hypothetical protein
VKSVGNIGVVQWKKSCLSMAHNGLGLAEGVEIEAPKLNLLLMFNRITNVE